MTGLRAAGQPTLEAVAARAGVSRATVSRVVNGSPRVSEAARRAVERAVEELGYVPNHAARSLVTRRTQSLALVIAEPEDRLFTDPFFAGIVRGVSRELARAEHQLVLLMRRSDAEHERLERYLGNGHVDGVMIVSLHGDDPLPARLERRSVPVVMGGRPQRTGSLRYVDVDNVEGARSAVGRLLELGRRRIATITGPPDMAASADRFEGYRLALAGAGLAVDDELVVGGTFERDSGADAMGTLLRRCPDVDAVFAASDLMAAGALATLEAAGRGVPDDVALVGFDDTFVARSTRPQLTTVRQPIERMGAEMARLLLAAVEGRALPDHVLLPTELVVRESA